MFVRAATLIGAAAIFSSAAHADVGFMTGFGAGRFTISSGPYDDCPPGTYQNKNGDCVERPDSNRGGATGQCCDGTDTHAENRTGACSRHGGVCQWFAAAGAAGADPTPSPGRLVTALASRGGRFVVVTWLAGPPWLGTVLRLDAVGCARRHSGSGAVADRCEPVPLGCLAAARLLPTAYMLGRSCW